MLDALQFLNNSSVIALIAFLLPFVIFFRRLKRNKPEADVQIDEKLLDERIKSFKPKPLIPEEENDAENTTNAIHEEHRMIVDLAKVNYLNLLNNKDIMQDATDCIKEYGVGTCGPRGFYGTTDKHLTLEAELAKFLGTEEAIVYAYGFTTLSTAIGAYCNAEDLIFCDELINFPIKQGLLAARCEVINFKHNNTAHLLQKLEENAARTKRKFLIVEGIYEKTGALCKLPEMVKLATQFKLRIFLDESISFGVVGINGKGVTEHFHISISDVDLIIGSLENALGSIGGFCAGTNTIIEYQRLKSTGYVFSASLPTYLCEVATKALSVVENNSIFLQILSTRFQEFLVSIDNIFVLSDPISPLKKFTYRTREDRNKHIEEGIYEYCRDHYLYLILNNDGLALHLNVELYFNEDRLKKIFDTISNAVAKCEGKSL